MFQYEFEKRPPSSNSCSSRATMTTDWSRAYPSSSRTVSIEHARRPLPPRPIVCERIPVKHTVPLKVWIIASASCFAVCAALVLATVLITKWGSQGYTRELFESQEQAYTNSHQKYNPPDTPDDIPLSILEKLPMFKNVVANRNDDLTLKPQIHPLHDEIEHVERKIEKKDQAKFNYDLTDNIDKELIDRNNDKLDTDTNNVEKDLSDNDKDLIGRNGKRNDKNLVIDTNKVFGSENSDFDKDLDKNDRSDTKFDIYKDKLTDKFDRTVKSGIPDFKPTLPDIFINKHKDIKLFDGYITGLRKHDYEEYYNDENLYDDYLESNSLTNYLIEKVQELHNWITTDTDFVATKDLSKKTASDQFGQLLKALNESLVEGNVTIIMSKLREMYFGENYTIANNTRKILITNSTDLLSFGILSLDVMLLHNIQLMAWENQEAARIKMLKDSDVFAFNALFLDPSKVEAKQNEINHHDEYYHPAVSKRQNIRQDDEFSVGKTILDNFLEIGMSTARAAIHLGRAYKNTKNILNHIKNNEPLNSNIQNQLSRNIDGNAVALKHLQESYTSDYTELDCVWLLYCRNLAVTAKLNAPYGTMARINGLALRMLTGELPADRALDTMLYEAFTGWTELKCNDMFPKCSRADAASVVLNTILQPVRKSQSRSQR